MVRFTRRGLLFLGAALLPLGRVASAASVSSLEAGFRAPPNAARPRVWWHWMNGNVSLPGIDADFDWMARVGIGGVHNFDAGLETPPLTPVRLPFLSPGWRDAFRYAVSGADRRGLEFAIAGSPGWSESGGPWVTPQQAMKKLVWSETEVEAGVDAVRLAAPPTISGPFMDLPTTESFKDDATPRLYRDVAVLACRQPSGVTPLPAARVTASAAVDLTALNNGDRTASIQLPYNRAESWIRFDYDMPVTVRALTLVATKAGGAGSFGQTGPRGRLEVSADGERFNPVAELPFRGAPQMTVSFAPATGRSFRIVLEPRPAPANGPATTAHGISELRLIGEPRVTRFEDKAGWSSEAGLEAMPTLPVEAGMALAPQDIVDLTGLMRPDGTLDWRAPEGRWTVLRFGWSLTGRQNHPASPEGTGLEVDKLSRKHVRAYADAYLGEYEATVGRAMMGARGLGLMLTDSYEAGIANWTEDMPVQFARLRGYDLRPWLPALAGRVVGSAQESDAFLWDFRQTIGALMASEHYDELSRALHERGMKRYGESHEGGRQMLVDGMSAKRSADIPMGAMWTTINRSGSTRPENYDADLRESASVAHVYGQNLTACEAFTQAFSLYTFAPEQLKPFADRMMSNGVNRFVIHTSVHQPVDGPGPGVSLGGYGQFFTRKETWAEMAGPWISYLSRSSWLLQQGRFVADVAWFYGEDSNITALYRDALPPIPEGHAFDFVNADAVLNLLSVKGGRVTTPSGMSYAVLALGPETRRMSLPVLRKIVALAEAGAVVVGARPVEPPGLGDDAAEFERLADRLWSSGGRGRGRVFPILDLEAAFEALRIELDVRCADARLQFVRRDTAEGPIYFLSARSQPAQEVEVSFRQTGRAPQLWRADDGTVEDLGYRVENGRTVVFVVFNQPARPGGRAVQRDEVEVLTTLEGPWTLAFPEGRGAPGVVTLPKLVSWTEHSDPGVRYFSGMATYVTQFNAPATRSGSGRVVIDLGAVKQIAEVRLNGKPVGYAWRPPFQVDVTDAITAGMNTLEVKVANLWPNRMIGDKQPGATVRYSSATTDPFEAGSPLLPSGLLGPVRLLQVRKL